MGIEHSQILFQRTAPGGDKQIGQGRALLDHITRRKIVAALDES